MPSKSRFTTLKTVEIRSFGPDSEDLYDRIAELMAATAVGELDVRTLTRAMKAACCLIYAMSTQAYMKFYITHSAATGLASVDGKIESSSRGCGEVDAR